MHFIPAYGGSILDDAWVQFALSLPVFIIGFIYFGKSSYQALKQGLYHMDLLIFIGSTSAFVYSLIGALTSNPSMLFFETSAMIITLVLLGNYIENRTVKQTQSAIEGLKKLQVDKALLMKENGQSIEIPAKELKVGDRVLVNQGDSFPADGKILKGDTYVDESMITGESDPIFKSIGNEVIGSTLSSTGSVIVEVSRIGSESILQRMINLVKEAQREKAPVQRLADKISGIFVPAVIAISFLAFILNFWILDQSLTQSILNSIAVLVISCPCAMGLATPTAIAAGVGRMSRNGILVKSGRILELFAKTKSFLFDKTGTLTTGEYKLLNIEAKEQDTSQIKALIVELEKHSSHPIAKSLVELFSEDVSLNVPKFDRIEEVKGKGMKGHTANGDVYFIGNAPKNEDSSKNIALYKNKVLIAQIKLKDELRINTRSTMEMLKAQGQEIAMLSGDAIGNVERLANELEIENFYAASSPEQKYDIIRKAGESKVVAMVGDGINDAAALNKADVGISMSNATNIAINAADIVLMRQDLSLIPKALKISKLTLQTIKQNLFWAFSYNIVAIPLAALGFLNPMWGALFMTFSDVVVVGNSVRLIYRKIK